MKNIFNVIIISLFSIIFISSCQIVRPIGEEKRRNKIIVDAYQFNAKLKRKKNPASFKLNVFQTDSLIAFTAKGYMNKGAMKGLMSPDSLKAYFPMTKEHVSEEISEFFASINCSGSAPKFDFFRLFSETPVFLKEDFNAFVEIVELNPNSVKYSIRFYGCRWYLDITYDRKNEGWRIRQFKFSDGKNSTLTGKRHQYNHDAKVKRSFFEYSVPFDAVRITP
jgi:hypothetical protein